MDRRDRGHPAHGLMRRALLLVALVALAAPGAASAHLRTSRDAVDYRASVLPFDEPLRVRVYPADLALGLTLLGAHRVVVLGYLGEPFLRLEPQGMFVNAASPTAAGAKLARPRAPSSRPLWVLRSHRPSAIWHDARVRGLPRGITNGTWRVPLLVDGRRTRLGGTLQRVSAPAAWPWIAAGAGFAAALALALRRRTLIRPATVWLGVLAAGAAVLSAIGFATASSASQGAWIEGANEAVVALAATVFLIRGSSNTRALAGGFLGLLALAIGLTKLPVLLHGIVLSALPGNLARLAVVVAIGAGAAAATLGLVVFFDVLERYEEEPQLLRDESP
jgi:hypothetical protein